MLEGVQMKIKLVECSSSFSNCLDYFIRHATKRLICSRWERSWCGPDFFWALNLEGFYIAGPGGSMRLEMNWKTTSRKAESKSSSFCFNIGLEGCGCCSYVFQLNPSRPCFCLHLHLMLHRLFSCQHWHIWGNLDTDLSHSHLLLGAPAKKSKQQQAVRGAALMIPGEGWQLARRCLQDGQLWTPWDDPDESILHLSGQEKGEDNCSVLTAASNCFERWRTVMKPGVTSHLGSDKSLGWDSERVLFLPFILH